MKPFDMQLDNHGRNQSSEAIDANVRCCRRARIAALAARAPDNETGLIERFAARNGLGKKQATTGPLASS